MRSQESSVCHAGLFVATTLLLAVGEAAAAENQKSAPSPAQRRILAELESRWWGWQSAPAPIAPAPKSWKLLDQEWPLSAQHEVVLLTAAEPSPQEAYIAEMLRRELVGKHHIPCRVTSNLDAPSNGNPVIYLGTFTGNPPLAELCRAKNVGLDQLTRPESYLVDFLDDRTADTRSIVVAGGDPVGCIHGGYSLMQLIESSNGQVALNACRVHDYPTVAVRSLRGVGESLGMKLQVHTDSRYLGRKITADEIHPDELLLPCLDRLARNRINCYHILSGLHNGPQLPQRMGHLVEESRRRGIKVVGGFRPVGAQQGDRSTFPCYCNEDQMELVLGHFRQYIEAGCDFIYFMADDYYRDKYPGHCEKCIARFGDLAGEQIYMLHRIVDLAHDLGMPNQRILFCPTHYDARSPADVEYLKTFHDDPKLRGIQFTFTYLTEDVIQQRNQALPDLSYALFYNGPRWLAYYCRNMPNTGAVLANHARNAMYFPVYYGWHAAQYSPTEGWFVNTTEQVRKTFHKIIPRETKDTTLLGNIANYSDSIFKGPIEYALWGHYCWNPAAHDTRQSETAVGDSLFGPGNGRTLAQLNRVLLDLTRLVYQDVTPPKNFLETIEDRFELARLLHRRLEEDYLSYAQSVAPDYIPPTQDFHARLGIEDIQKYLAKMEHVVQARGLLDGDGPHTAPSPRYAGVTFPAAEPGTLLVSGGCQGGNLTNCLGDLWRYSTADDRWEELKAPPKIMSPRCGHSAVTVGEKVFFFGGTSDSFTDVHNSLHEFDVKTATFREIADTQGGPPPARLVHAASADDRGRIWIFGGFTTDRKTLDDLWCYHSTENRWEAILEPQGDLPGERYGSRVACVGDTLYLFGGRRQDGPTLDDLYRFEPQKQRWTRIEPATDERPGPRYAPAFIAVGRRIYLFGGGGGSGFLNDLFVYEPAANRWQKLAPAGEIPGPRGCALPLATDGKRIYLFSGAQSAARYGTWINGDLYSYDLTENSFTKLRSSIAW